MSPYLGGEKSADIVVIVVSQFRCSHCAEFADLSRDLWESRDVFKKRVRLYFHHYPSNNETIRQVHSATVAAFNQGVEHFWFMQDYIWEGYNANPQRLYEQQDLVKFADEVLGLDMVMFEKDMESTDTLGFLQWDKKQAEEAGVSGVPAVFVCGEKISWSAVEEEVDSFLNP